MRRINLLPAWYIKQRHERRMLRLRLLLIACLGAAMLAWKLSSNVQIARLQALASELREQRDIVRNLAEDVQQSDRKNQQLEQWAASYRLLGQPAPIYELLQQVHNDLTPGMALSAFTMDVRQEPLPGSGNVGDAHNPPRYRHTAVFRVEGIAPNDQQVAQMVDSLSHNPLFLDVSMNFTRPDVLRGLSVRRFQIRLTVDLERIPAGDPAATLQAMSERDHHEL